MRREYVIFHEALGYITPEPAWDWDVKNARRFASAKDAHDQNYDRVQIVVIETPEE